LAEYRVADQGHTTVVYIEADHANALLMQCLLGSRANFALHHAIDGKSGLELCRRVTPDLVLTESRLPDMTAYEILLALRADAATACMPCIVLSGDAMPGNIKRALAAGFHEYWTKPVDIWQLLRKIEEAASHSRRLPVIPEVPTLPDGGLAGFVSQEWSGVVVAKEMPFATVQRLAKDIRTVTAAPDLKARRSQLERDSTGSARAEFSAFVQAEVTEAAAVAKERSFKSD
jgi:CheY-like chemotaxis protein